MTDHYEFDVPGNPSVKQRPRVMRHHTFTTKSTMTGEQRVRNAFRAKYPQASKLQGRVGLIVICYMADNRSKDWDNLGKLVSDALNKVAYRDDSQIASAMVRVYKPDQEMPGKHGPRKRRTGDPITYGGEPMDPHTHITVTSLD